MAKTGAQFEYASRLENSYIERIERLLAPILGSESVRAQVTADIDFTVSEQTQESFNPDTPALRSNQTMVEQSIGSSSNNGGVPGALSNQPPGTATAPETSGAGVDAESGSPSSSHRKETKNYELDKTISHTRFSMGRLRRLSVAVVVDDNIITAADGSATRMQRTPEELDRLSNLVKEAVGFNAQRGDTLNMMNSSFTVPVAPEELPAVPIWEQGWAQDMAKKSLGALLVIFMLFGVLKPILKQLATQSKLVPAIAPPEGEEQGVANDIVTLGANSSPRAITAPGSYEQNLATATQAVEQDPKLVAQVVKNWVASDG
jgi:flagellar M-ring protein FliF